MTSSSESEPVLVVVQAARGTLSVTGPDAKTWLNGLITCDVLGVAPGAGRFGLSLNKQGKIQSEVLVVATPDGLLLGVSPGVARDVCAVLDKMLIMEDAELSNASDDYTWSDFHGSGALTLAESAARALGGVAASMPFTSASSATLVLGRDRQPGLEAWLASHAEAKLATDAEWEAFRIAHALGRFGIDFTDADNPHEAALDRRAVSWNKGCYLGQEVVCMQDMRGKLKRRLVALSFASEAPPAAGAVVSADGETAGEVTSAAPIPATGRAVALARLKSPYFEGKVALSVNGVPAVFVEQTSPE